MRCFLAFPVSDQLKKKIGEVLKVLKRLDADVKWVELPNLHLTLKFYENLEETQLKDLICEVNRLVKGFSAIEAQLGGLGCFPGLNHPKVIWIGLQDPQGQMMAIAAALKNQTFEPHITIGRVKSGKNVHKLIDAIKRIKMEKQPERLTKILLYKSTLTAQGPVYQVIQEFNLQKERSMGEGAD